MPLDETELERLKEIFVTRRECDSTVDEINKKLANDSTRLAVIEVQLKAIKWLQAAIAGGIVALVIKVFMGG